MPTWRAPGEHVERGVVPPPTANQGCSSAQWVPMEELEGDMTTALVVEAFLALPHGLPARLHHGRRDRGGQKSKVGEITPHCLLRYLKCPWALPYHVRSLCCHHCEF